MVNGGHFQKGMTATSLNVGSRAAETRHLEFCYFLNRAEIWEDIEILYLFLAFNILHIIPCTRPFLAPFVCALTF